MRPPGREEAICRPAWIGILDHGLQHLRDKASAHVHVSSVWHMYLKSHRRCRSRSGSARGQQDSRLMNLTSPTVGVTGGHKRMAS